jgi:hypothetical protein
MENVSFLEKNIEQNENTIRNRTYMRKYFKYKRRCALRARSLINTCFQHALIYLYANYR